MQNKKYNSFDHASHNLKVNTYLRDNGDFPDWEITTAFYTSLKFIEGSLFPFNYQHPTEIDYYTFNHIMIINLCIIDLEVALLMI